MRRRWRVGLVQKMLFISSGRLLSSFYCHLLYSEQPLQVRGRCLSFTVTASLWVGCEMVTWHLFGSAFWIAVFFLHYSDHSRTSVSCYTFCAFQSIESFLVMYSPLLNRSSVTSSGMETTSFDTSGLGMQKRYFNKVLRFRDVWTWQLEVFLQSIIWKFRIRTGSLVQFYAL